MSYFVLGSNKSELQKIEEKLETSLGRGEFGDEQVGKIVADMESIDSLGTNEQDLVSSAVGSIQEAFDEAGLTAYLVNLVDGAEDATHPTVQTALHAATAAALASGNPAAYSEAYLNPKAGSSDFTTLGHAKGFDLEGFDNFKFDTFQVKSILTAGITTATSPFSQTFFRPVVLPASQSGYDLRVTVPQTYKRKYHAGSGAPFQLDRKPLVRAARDFTILEDNSLEVIPVKDAARAASFSTVPVETVSQHGIQIDTAPLAYGKKISLIDVSSNSVLIKNGEMTEQDTLDPLVSIGKQFIHMDSGAGSEAFIEADISTMPGAMMNYAPEGNTKEQHTTFSGQVHIFSTSEARSKSPIGAEVDVSDLAWLTGDFRMTFDLRISATLDVDGNLTVDANHIELTEVWHGVNYATAADAAQLAAFKADQAFELVGYTPIARRSNSSMRDTGTIVDTGETYNWRLAAPLNPPLTSVKPISAMGNGVSLDALSAVSRLRNLGTAVTSLFNFENKLIATQALGGQAAAIGGILVDSTYLQTNLDVFTMVRNRDSRHGQEDLGVHLVNAITMQANRLITQSGYLPALQMYTGSRSNFEVIVTTDPVIANLLMTSGDGRTLGNNRRFKVTELDDERMAGHIYISLNRTDVTGADILSHGCQITCPGQVHQARVTLGGNTSDQTQLIPRESFHHLLPCLARIDVTNLYDYYLQTTTP